MNINTTPVSSSHPKLILQTLKSTEGLPFRAILSPETVAAALADVKYRERYGFYPPDITLWAFLSQVFDDDHSLEAAVARVIAFHLSFGRENDISSNTAAYSKARSKLPEEIISELARQSGAQMEAELPAVWLWKGRHMKLIDGSTVSMPDTAENQAAHPQSGTQKKGVGFPVARIVAVISSVTGAVLDLAVGAYSGKKTGEHALLRQIIHVFKNGDIALGDCYYGSFFLMAMLIQIGVDAVFPIHAGRDHDFRRGKKLGKKDHIVEWPRPKMPEWMEQEMYDAFPEKISIREVSVNSERKGFQTKSRIIVTTFLDSAAVSKNDLTELYSCRWWIELDLRSIKDVLKMDVLRGKTPGMVHKEIWAHVLGYNMIRKIMAQAAHAHNKTPRELSFKLALHVIKSFREAGLLTENNGKIYAIMLKSIARKKVGNRPFRKEPRRVKRRPKPFPLLTKARNLYNKKKAS